MTSSTSRARRAVRPLAVGAALAAVLLAAGCTTADDAPPSRVTVPSAEPTPDATSTVSADDPAGVLASYGLELPAGASAPQAQAGTDEVMSDVWLVTFTAPPADVEAMCVDAGIGEPRVSLRLAADELARFGLTEVPADSWICSASRPDDLQQQIRVLFDGDPATVRVALYTMPAR